MTTGFMVGTDAYPQPWNGLIGEIIVCSGSISQADRLNIEAYQKAYWGV